jgi:hypothetical protein
LDDLRQSAAIEFWLLQNKFCKAFSFQFLCESNVFLLYEKNINLLIIKKTESSALDTSTRKKLSTIRELATKENPKYLTEQVSRNRPRS